MEQEENPDASSSSTYSGLEEAASDPPSSEEGEN